MTTKYPPSKNSVAEEIYDEMQNEILDSGNILHGSHSSSSVQVTAQRSKYDAFVSFRRDDTRENFRSHLYAALCQQIYLDEKLDKTPPNDSFRAETYSSVAMVSDMEAGEFTAVNVSSFMLQSHLKNTRPTKTKIESGRNVLHLLLLISILLSAITFHTALNIQVCKSEQGYKYNSRLNPICQIVNQHPYVTRLFMALNSTAFLSSILLLMILFNECPLRPLLLACVFSMLGAYICTSYHVFSKNW